MSDREELVEIIKARLFNVPLHKENTLVLAVDSLGKLADALLEWHEKEVKRRIISLGNRVPTKTVIEGGNL